jgi:hypothetical protein
MSIKISHKKALESISKKLEYLKVKSSRTINAYTKEANKIITSGYKVMDRLKQLNSSITPESKTFAQSKQVLVANKKEAKQVILTTKHSSKLDAVKTFNKNKNSFIKVLGVLGKIPKKNISIKDLPISI